jgi:hypothetical protein
MITKKAKLHIISNKEEKALEILDNYDKQLFKLSKKHIDKLKKIAGK